jgi:Ni,Fe-hydrogenase I large subunit
MKKAVILVTGIMQLVMVTEAIAGTPAVPTFDPLNIFKEAPKLSKKEISQRIGQVEQAIKTIEVAPLPQQLQQAEKMMLEQTKNTLNIISRNLNAAKQQVLMAVAKKIKGFDANRSFNDIQQKINQTIKQLQSMSSQQRAQALADISADMDKFQNTIKANVRPDLLLLLASLQSKIAILAGKTKNIPTTESAALKQKVKVLKQDVKNLKTLGLQQDAQKLKAEVAKFKASTETNLGKLKNEVIKIYAMDRDMYKKALAQ